MIAMPRPRWRALLGLAIMLVAIVQSTASIDDPARLVAAGIVALVMCLGFAVQLSRFTAVGIWLLGLSAALLMALAPGNGAIIGVISAIVIGALRLPVRHGALAAAVNSSLFMLAYAFSSHGSALLGMAFTAIGLGFAYMATASVRRIREEGERAESLLVELRQTRAAEIERAALAERTRIAREIHDVLAHTLSALAVQLEGTRMLVEQRPGDPAAVAAVERAHRLAREGLAEAGRAIGALRGDQLPGPDGLARLVEDFSSSTGTPGHFEATGEPIQLSTEAQVALYRTAQEALTNVRKHARATSVEVRVRYTEDGAELVVKDAAPATNGTNSGGYGLVGMRERAELVGGALEAGPLPTGFRVRLWLPKQ